MQNANGTPVNISCIEALRRFHDAMLAKLVERDAKQGDRSVTRVGGSLLNEDGVYEGLWAHFYNEVAEMQLAGHIEDEIGEAIDVANLAFLIWWRDNGGI